MRFALCHSCENPHALSPFLSGRFSRSLTCLCLLRYLCIASACLFLSFLSRILRISSLRICLLLFGRCLPFPLRASSSRLIGMLLCFCLSSSAFVGCYFNFKRWFFCSSYLRHDLTSRLRALYVGADLFFFFTTYRFQLHLVSPFYPLFFIAPRHSLLFAAFYICVLLRWLGFRALPLLTAHGPLSLAAISKHSPPLMHIFRCFLPLLLPSVHFRFSLVVAIVCSALLLV